MALRASELDSGNANEVLVDSSAVMVSTKTDNETPGS